MQKALGALDRPGLAAVLASLSSENRLVTQGRSEGIPKGKPPAARLGGLAAVLASAAVAEHRESEIPEPTAPAVDSRPLPVLLLFSLQLATAHRLRTQPTRVGLEGAGRSIHPGRRKHATAGSARSEPRMVSRAQRGERSRATWGFPDCNTAGLPPGQFLTNFSEVLRDFRDPENLRFSDDGPCCARDGSSPPRPFSPPGA